MEIEIHLPALLQSSAGGSSIANVAASTPAEALERLFEFHPVLRTHLFDEAGERREHVLIFLNNEDTRWLTSMNVKLSAGDKITILQAVSGG